MSLNISKLKNVRVRGGKTIARCPACAEAGHDQKGEHLVINADDSFGCVVYPGDSGHRKRIFALCGDRQVKPLIIHGPQETAGVGRLERVNQSQSAGQPLKTGLLGRLGRVFETHVEQQREPVGVNEHNTEHQLNDCEKNVLGVLRYPKTTPNRPLTDRERVLLMRWCGTENDRIILEAMNLFNATIVGIVQTAAFSPAKRRGANGSDQLNGA
jgi:hypothetical protein